MDLVFLLMGKESTSVLVFPKLHSHEHSRASFTAPSAFTRTELVGWDLVPLSRACSTLPTPHTGCDTRTVLFLKKCRVYNDLQHRPSSFVTRAARHHALSRRDARGSLACLGYLVSPAGRGCKERSRPMAVRLPEVRASLGGMRTARLKHETGQRRSWRSHQEGTDRGCSGTDRRFDTPRSIFTRRSQVFLCLDVENEGRCTVCDSGCRECWWQES